MTYQECLNLKNEWIFKNKSINIDDIDYKIEDILITPSSKDNRSMMAFNSNLENNNGDYEMAIQSFISRLDLEVKFVCKNVGNNKIEWFDSTEINID